MLGVDSASATYDPHTYVGALKLDFSILFLHFLANKLEYECESLFLSASHSSLESYFG